MADEVLLWKNVTVDVETSRGAEIAITSITNAEEGVVTYSGTVDPQDGDYVHITKAAGMPRLRDRLFRIDSVDSDAKTFVLEGEDTTEYGTLTSGAFAIVSFGASFESVQNLAPSGGEPSDIDITTIHDDGQRSMNGSDSPITYAFTNFFKPTDPGYQAFRKARLVGKKRAVLIGFPEGARIGLIGYPSASGNPTGSAGQPVMVACQLKVQGEPSVYTD